MTGQPSAPSASAHSSSDSIHMFTPATITDRAYWDDVRNDPALAALVASITDAALQIPAAPPRPLASDYLAARRHNDRHRLDAQWQNGRRMLSQLAVNRCFMGVDPGDCDDRLLDWLWSFLTEPSWCVSAHLPNKDLPALGQPTLDLAACEMAAMLAEMREVLLPWINSNSRTLADSIIHAVDEQVIRPFEEAPEHFWWTDVDNVHMNNWTGVCAGSILAAARSLAAQGHARPVAEAKAIKLLGAFFERAFTPSGECDEGMGYWGYGVGVASLGLSRLAPGELAGAIDMGRFRQVADYPRRVHLVDDWFYSGNDSSLHCGAPQYLATWLAAAADNLWMGQWARRAAFVSPPQSAASWRRQSGADPPVRHFSMFLRTIDAYKTRRTQSSPAPSSQAPGAAVSNDTANASPPAKPTLIEDQQAAVFRLPTDAGNLIVTLAGGTNGERHNHNDLGHVLLFLDGQLILPDLGAPHYTADFFSANRYTYLTASSRGHSCPVINGQEQRVGSDAAGTILAWRPDADTPEFSLDLTTAYPPEANLTRWTRTLRQLSHHFELIDDYQTTRAAVGVTHALWSLAEPVVQKNVLKIGPIFITLNPAPVRVTITTHQPADLLLRSFTDRLLYQIQAEYQTDATGELKVTSALSAGPPDSVR